MTDLPNPYVTAEVDLRGLPWMPLDITRLLNSDFYALAKPDEFRAALTLWCASWYQQPAASLPANEAVLAELARAGGRWSKIRARVMHGWVKCSDGRLYHKVLAEAALKAWQERQRYQTKREKEAERLHEWREKKRAEKGVPRGTETHGETRTETVGETPSETRTETRLKRSGNGLEETGTGKGQGRDRDKLPVQAKTEDVPPNGGGHSPAPGPTTPETVVWQDGVKLLTTHGMAETSARSFIGKAVKILGITGTLDAIGAAVDSQTGDPKGYIAGVMRRKAPGADGPTKDFGAGVNPDGSF